MDVGGGIYNSSTLQGGIWSMTTFNNKLWCTGGFDVAGTITNVVNIATWDGNTWQAIYPGNSSNGNINAFQEYIDGKLYIGGGFKNTGGWIYGNQISRWNGNMWENFTPGIFSNVAEINSLASYKNKLYAGGSLWEISGVNVNRIACWDSIIGWQDVDGGMENSSQVSALSVYNDELIAAGTFYWAGGKEAWNVARWNGTEWNPVGKLGLYGNGMVTMTIDTVRNFLYVAGAPTWADGDTGTAVVQWDGKRWSFICHYSSISGYPHLCMYHDELYMSGIDPYVLPSGDTLFGVAKWDGKNWKPIGRLSVWGTGTQGCMGPLVDYNDTLYFGSRCDSADNMAIHNIARWYSPPDTTCDVLLYNFNKIWAQDTTYFCDTIRADFDNNTSYADTWFWDFGDGETDTLSEPVHIYDNAGTYYVSLITSYKYCTDTAYKTVTTLPCDSSHPIIYGVADTIFMQQDAYDNWYAQPIFYCNSPNADFWWWDFGNDTQDSSNVFNYGGSNNVYLTPGTFVITLIITNDCCIDTVYDTLTVIKPSTGLTEVSNVKIEYLWQNIPNPFDNSTTIPYYVPFGSKGFLQITDAKGELIDEYALQQGKNTLNVSLEYLKAGTYFYSIIIDLVMKGTKKMMLD